MSRLPRPSLTRARIGLGVLAVLGGLAAWGIGLFSPGRPGAGSALVPVAAAAPAPEPASPTSSWLHWRGPQQNGVSTEKDLPDSWSLDPNKANNNLVWSAPYGCRSAPVVNNGRVYIINNAGEDATDQERIMCFDAKTGKVLWEKRFNVFFTDIVAVRIGWTNLAGDAETGNVYAHGSQGLLICFDPDGKILWQHSLTEEYGRVSGYGGRLASPIVDGDLVIIGMVQASWGDHARGNNRFVAFNKKTGEVVWWGDTDGPLKETYYSNPTVAVINGERLLLSGAADGCVYAFKVRTGEKVWKYPYAAKVVNSSVVVQGNYVYATHGEENLDEAPQGRIVCLDASKITDGKPALVWEHAGVKCGYTSPIIHGNDLFVCDDSARIYLFDALKGGDPKWKYAYGKVSRGSGTWADGKIYIAEVNSKFHILKPTEEKCLEPSKPVTFTSADGQGSVEVNSTPAIVDGKIYFGTRDTFYCLGKKDHTAKADPLPPVPPEKPAANKPSFVQVVPADVAVHPGETVTFKARTYDANGEFLKEVEAEWSLPEPTPPPMAKAKPPALKGEITKDGKLTVDKMPPGQQGYVDAKVGELVGRARVRVAPVLPYKNDFSKVPVGVTPGGWVNTQGKFAVVELPDKTHALKKLNDSPRPPLARANAYISLPHTKDYTIEVDLMGENVSNNMPDAGVSNSRYTLLLDGNKQQLRLVSWEALPRVDKTIPFAWSSEAWYRMKFTVAVENGKAVARGKVWPRGKDEPKAWTVEFTDDLPNIEGAPTLYGYATGTVAPCSPVYYQNLAITPNGSSK
jgi:outer membrane protein assembly factor BamB